MKGISRSSSSFVNVLILAMALSMLAYAPVYAATPIFVRPGGDDTLCNGTANVDYSAGAAPACAVATIQKGVDLVDTGGTVNVAAGNYVEAQILITKSVTVTGAGLATTTIDGNNVDSGSGLAGLVRIDPPSGDTGAVNFSGFTITNPGSIGGTRAGMFVKSQDAAMVVTISNNKILGVNTTDYGIWVYRSIGSVVFTNNQITNTGYNAVLVEQPFNATDFSNNTITAAGASTSYFAMTYDGVDVTTLQKVANNIINSPANSGIIFNASPSFVGTNGRYTNVQITGNTITNLGSGRTGVGLLNDTSDVSGALGAIENPTVTGNTITGTSAGSSYGVQLRGLVTNANISNNNIRDLDRGFWGRAATAGHAATGTVMHYNNIVNHTTGFVWDGTAAINAENNWWGCNAGPGNTGCPTVGGTGSASVDYDPWIVLGISASPSLIVESGTSTVTADMTKNSSGAAAGGTTPAIPVNFSATNGNMSPSAGTITSGVANSTFTSTNSNDGSACATVDNQQVCTTITVSTNDAGDLPSPYTTLLASSGPSHIASSGLYLGACVDGEADGQPNSGATGDDANVGSDTSGTCAVAGDDEDGVTRVGGAAGTGKWTDGTVASGNGGAVQVIITAGSGCLGAFLDLAPSGSLTAVTLRDSGGTAVVQPLAVGTHTLYFDVPGGTFSGTSHAVYGRFRVTSPVAGSCSGSAAFAATGSASDGEVEDYAWDFGPNAVALSGLSAMTPTQRPLAILVGMLALAGLAGIGLGLRRQPGIRDQVGMHGHAPARLSLSLADSASDLAQSAYCPPAIVQRGTLKQFAGSPLVSEPQVPLDLLGLGD